MKKVIPVVFLLIILSGIGAIVAYTHYLKPSTRQTFPIMTTQNTSNTMFNSIKDAMSKSLSLQCEYTDQSQKMTKVYIKAGSIRSDSQNSSNSAEIDSAIMKNNKLYVWSNQQNQGTIIDFSVNNANSTISGMANNQSSHSSTMQGENFIKDFESQKEHCKSSIIADSLFTLPKNITFLDLGNMMKAASIGAHINYQQYVPSPTR